MMRRERDPLYRRVMSIVCPKPVSDFLVTMSHDPHRRLFFSCVNSEFRSYRELLTEELKRRTLEVKVEEDFLVTGYTTLEMLDDYIKLCDGVIHLIGDATGSIPEAPAVERLLKRYPDFMDRLKSMGTDLSAAVPGISYTQWEAYLAIYHDGPLFIYYPDSAAPRDPEFMADGAQKEAQARHFGRIKAPGRDRRKFANRERLSSLVLGDLVEILPTLRDNEGVEVAPSRLRHHADTLIGRDHALDRLDAAWASESIRVVVVHAWGGVGKTSLVAAWRARWRSRAGAARGECSTGRSTTWARDPKETPSTRARRRIASSPRRWHSSAIPTRWPALPGTKVHAWPNWWHARGAC